MAAIIASSELVAELARLRDLKWRSSLSNATEFALIPGEPRGIPDSEKSTISTTTFLRL